MAIEMVILYNSPCFLAGFTAQSYDDPVGTAPAQGAERFSWRPVQRSLEHRDHGVDRGSKDAIKPIKIMVYIC